MTHTVTEEHPRLIFKYVRHIGSKLTKSDYEQVRQILEVPLPDGMGRTLYKCKSCKQVMASVYVPYGISYGRAQNPCHCMLVEGPNCSRLFKVGENEWVESTQ